ncbi:MBL fold metallo-hydrolase [Marivita sp. S0852]|uniref:MBL fold metallo-hydrolase n=1 Tax=Marivita sp. S0852 TaxID=3373893 RepID=UPI003981F73A
MAHDPHPPFTPTPGDVVELSPGIRRIVANNPSPMTYRGTNTYLIGTRDLAVIDPGPRDPKHLAALLSGIGSARVAAIFVTHAHLDHSPLARDLSAETGAPVVAFSDALGGRSAVMQRLAASGLMRGGEGVDASFQPDHTLSDTDRFDGSDWSLTALHTPGHFGNHLCFALEDILFCGDLVMGWATSLVSPPDGDLTDFMASCRRLQGMSWSTFHSGHGAPISDPAGRLDWLIQHRLNRETSLLEALQHGAATSGDLAKRVYTDTPATLMPAATRNVLAHMIDLYGKNIIEPVQELTADTAFRLL